MGSGDDDEGTVDCSFVTVSIDSKAQTTLPVGAMNGVKGNQNGGKDDQMVRSTSMMSMGTVNQQHSMPSLSIKASSNKLLAYVQSALARSVAGTSASGIARSSSRIKVELTETTEGSGSNHNTLPQVESMTASHAQDFAQVKAIVDRRGEELLFFGYVQEPKHGYKRVYTKVLVITNVALSNYKPGKCKRGHNRSIHLSNIVRVLCYSDNRDGFVLQSRHDFDLKFMSTRREELLTVLTKAIKLLTSASIPVLTLKSSEIEMAIHSKPLVSLMGWIRRHENAANNERPSALSLNPRLAIGHMSSRKAQGGDLPVGNNQLVPLLPVDCLVIAAIRTPRFVSYDKSGDRSIMRVLPKLERTTVVYERLQTGLDKDSLADRSRMEASFHSGIASDFANYIADSNLVFSRVVRSRASRFPKPLSDAAGTIEEFNPSSALSEAETVGTGHSQPQGASSVAAHTSQGGVANMRGSLTSGGGLSSSMSNKHNSVGHSAAMGPVSQPPVTSVCEYCKKELHAAQGAGGEASPPASRGRSNTKPACRKNGSNHTHTTRSSRATIDVATAVAAAAVAASVPPSSEPDDAPVSRFGRKWHVGCFRCTNPNCKKWLYSKDAGPEGYSLLHTAKFYPESGELSCSRSCFRDFIISASLRASPGGDAQFCPGCAVIVNEETEKMYGKAVTSCGYTWHSDHLKCSSCQHLLQGQEPASPHHRGRKTNKQREGGTDKPKKKKKKKKKGAKKKEHSRSVDSEATDASVASRAKSGTATKKGKKDEKGASGKRRSSAKKTGNRNAELKSTSATTRKEAESLGSLVEGKEAPKPESEWVAMEYKDWPYCKACYRKKFQTCHSCSAVVDLSPQKKSLSKPRSDASLGLSNLRASMRKITRLSSNISHRSSVSTGTMLAFGNTAGNLISPNIFGQSNNSIQSNNQSTLSLATIGAASTTSALDLDVLEPIFAMGRFWHQGHFNCHYCKSLFEDGIYFVEGDGRGARAFCRKHYFEFFMPKCHGCGLSIDDGDELSEGQNNHSATCEQTLSWVSFGGLLFHASPRCLKCARCHDSFMVEGGAFKFGYLDNGEALCMLCHLSTPAVSCDRCHRVVSNVGLIAETQRYPHDQRVFHVPRYNLHPECLTCSECHKNLLGGRVFALHRFKPEDEAELGDPSKLSVFLCERDCVKRIKGHGSCTGCGRSLVHFFDNNGFEDDITHGYHIVIYEDKPWHRSCFKCQFEGCNRSLLFNDSGSGLKPTRSSISLSSVTTSTTMANASAIGGQSLVSQPSNGATSATSEGAFASSFKHTSGRLYCWRHALKLTLVNGSS